MNTTTMTTTTHSDRVPVGPIIRRVHPHALKMLHGALPNGELFLTKQDARNMLVDLMVVLLPEEEIKPCPVHNERPVDDNTITTGELVERLATAARQRDGLKCELHTIAQLALIASTLSDQQKNLLLSVIHDRADYQSKSARRT
jgi:hypothetical protein